MTRRRGEGRAAHGPAVPAVPGGGLLAALPPTTARDRRARPHQGAGCRRRAALPRRPRRARRGRRTATRRSPPMPRVIGGRYGLSSKEFTPAEVAGVFNELAADRPKAHFTVGIYDDVTHLSLAPRPHDPLRPAAPARCRPMFFGLGSDGTVGANKSSVKIIGEETGALRPGLLRLRLQEVGLGHRVAPALRSRADPLDLPHRRRRLRRLPPVRPAREDEGARVRPAGRDVPAEQPVGRRRGVGPPADRGAARDDRQAHRRSGSSTPTAWPARRGMGNRINTVMQPCFFALSGVLPAEEAIGHIKASVEKTYGRRGRGDRRAQLRRHRRRARATATRRGPVPRRPPAAAASRDPSPTTRPTSSSG